MYVKISMCIVIYGWQCMWWTFMVGAANQMTQIII